MKTEQLAGANARLLAVIRMQGDVAKLGPDLAAVMSLVVERAHELTACHGAVIELVEGEEMVYRATAGAMRSHLGLRLRCAGSLSGLCVGLGEPLCCVDAEHDARVDLAACRRVGLRSMVVVPLRHESTVVGVLKVTSDRPHAFDDEDLRILGLMSEMIAAAMFHAAQYESGELFFRATHDALTGLANRALFYDRLRQCLDRTQRDLGRSAVLYVDMDGLKQINDRFGHRAGDAAIREAAVRIRGATRKSETVARLGGDEFGVILHAVEDRDGVQAHLQRLELSMAAPFAFEHSPICLRASVGAAVFPDDAVELDALLDVADRNMYAVKHRRKAPA